MNRRGFFRAALAGAVASCVRWLPMPESPRPVTEPERLPFAVHSADREWLERLCHEFEMGWIFNQAPDRHPDD